FDPDALILGAGSRDDASFHEVEMLDLFDRMYAVQDAICRFDFREGLRGMLDIASAGNQILQFNEPWKIHEEEPDTVAAVLNLCAQYLAALSLAVHPFMPEASGRLRKLLNIPPLEEHGAWVSALDALSAGEQLLPDGHALAQPEHLFSRIDDTWVKMQIDKLHAMSKPADASAEKKTEDNGQKPLITYDDFARLDIRTAKIVAAELVPKADKLLKLTLDVNGEQRTVVSGIAQYYQPGELPGKNVVLLANLEPRKIRGIESNGMILMAESGDGRLHFVQAATDETGMAIS